MANKAFAAIGLGGGSNGFLDTIKTATISDQDIGFVIVNGTEEFYVYTFDSGNVAGESSPDIIYPDDAVGTEAWILTDSTSGDNTIRGALSVTGTSTLTGNVDMAGNLDITGALTFGGAGVAQVAILDEDNFASDSAVSTATQQSIKAYIATVLGNATFDLMAGYISSPKFAWVTTSQITMKGFRLHHNGTSEQLLKSDATITYDFGSGGSNAHSTDLGASEWHYLYIDDSAVVTDGTTTVTKTEILNHTTAPTWDADQLGWYGSAVGNLQATDRCIGAFYSGSASGLMEFYHTGRNLTWATQIDLGVTWTTTWADVTMRVPAFATNLEAIVTISTTPSLSYQYHHWRVNGQSEAGGHEIGWSYNSGGGDNRRDMSYWSGKVITDSGGVIEIKIDVGTSTLSDLLQDGYSLPEGM